MMDKLIVESCGLLIISLSSYFLYFHTDTHFAAIWPTSRQSSTGMIEGLFSRMSPSSVFILLPVSVYFSARIVFGLSIFVEGKVKSIAPTYGG